MAVCESYCNNRRCIYRCTVSSTWGEERVRMTPLCVHNTPAGELSSDPAILCSPCFLFNTPFLLPQQ